MKKKMIMISALAALCSSAVLCGGCKTFVATVDALDGILGDAIVHEGEVERVNVSEIDTTIYFKDGMSYTCPGRQFASPGMTVKIREDENGRMYAE